MHIVEGRFHVHCDHRIPLLFGHAHCKAVLGDACVVDEDVDLAEVGEHLLYDLLSLFEIGGIAFVCLYLVAEGGDFRHGLLIHYEVGECHVGAFSSVLQCDCLSDSS